MKRLLLLSVVALFMHATSWAYDFRVDGIYYNVLDSVDLTCEVTYLSTSSSNYSAYQGSVEIPNTVGYENTTYAVTAIGDWAFRGCSGLTQVTIPNSVREIGWCAFDNCTGLTEVIIPESVTEIGDLAFAGCTGLVGTLIIPNSVTRMATGVFEGCTGLTSVTIPNSLIGISTGTFENCTGLTSIIIPESVTIIGTYAFCGCTGLTEVTSLNPEPPSCRSYSFSSVPTSTCLLYVPKGSKAAYSTAYAWKDFTHIVEADLSPVENIFANGNAEATEYYTLDGKQVSTPQRGLNIIRYSDGTARKVLVK